jgi:GNAT superfamily N-acetyltransferase
MDRPEIEASLISQVDGDAPDGSIALAGDEVAVGVFFADPGEHHGGAVFVTEVAEVEGVIGEAAFAPCCELPDEAFVPWAQSETVAVDQWLLDGFCGHRRRPFLSTRLAPSRQSFQGGVWAVAPGVPILGGVAVEIREAGEDDAPVLAGLRYAFRSSIGTVVEPREEFVARCAAWMTERLVAGSAWRCWVGEDGGAVVGHLWLQVVEKVPNPVPEMEHHAYITNVYVGPDARGRGVGEALVGAAMEWCRENRVDSAILWPTERSRPLYARFGFGVPEDMMEAIVDDGRDLKGKQA